MKTNVYTDKPVNNSEEDKFQRYEFSKRIADTIINSDNKDSVVIGIYGAWGEGKTSVMNFIYTELSKENNIINKENNIILFKFNPWRFTDEATLLESFYNKLAINIKDSIPEEEPKKNYLEKKFPKIVNRWEKLCNKKNKPLKTGIENFGDVISKYGSFIPINNIGKGLSDLGKTISNVDIEDIKSRFDDILVKSNKKLVIFIDDIDRLDKQEIHSIFRLVKLNADFKNTYYILFFDKEMVANSIGERFGEGNKVAGFDFLEKIIQVPLTIPLAQPEAILNYCNELINKSLNDNNISISEEGKRRFVHQFTNNVLIRIKTPRQAIRYYNSLLFSIPLLKGEVNIIDLMIIEALKIFYPEHYEFVKGNPNYFVNTYSSDIYKNKGIDERKNEVKTDFDEISTSLTNKEKECVKELLSELFPNLKSIFSNIPFADQSYTNWSKEKRIVSPKYFKRYFSYSVIEGELSDVLFDNFISNIEDSTIEDIITRMNKLINLSSSEGFLYKLREFEDDFDWNKSKKLALSIAKSGNLFPQKDPSWSVGINNPRELGAIFIYNNLKNNIEEVDRLEFTKQLINDANPFEFSIKISYWLSLGDADGEKIFSKEEYKILGRILINRALYEANNKSLYLKFPDDAMNLFDKWNFLDSDECHKYLYKRFELEPKTIIDFIRSLMKTEPFKSDFDKNSYNFLVSIYDKDKIYKLIKNQYSNELEEETVEFIGRVKNKQTDINILRQYIHWYELELKDNEKKD
jgi:predicted KAP-like P-loop ATPase/predicted transcriptional regulator